MLIYNEVGLSTDSEAAMIEALTWERIADLEPQLLDILREIKAECPREGTYFRIWGKYRQRFGEFVGWDRAATANPELQSSVVYDIVYDKLLNSLKDPE
jgi:hypothetical protein